MPQEGLEQRGAEGSRTGPIARGRSKEVMEARKGGRPKGSTNKSKSLIPTNLADKILSTLEGNVPSEQMSYMREVVKGGGSVSTKRELDVLILLLNRNLWPALVKEAEGEEELKFDDEGKLTGKKKEVVFRKDVTERLKVLNSLLTLRNQIEKGEKDVNDDGAKPLLQIFGDRDIANRIGVLVSHRADSDAGNTDGNGGRALQTGTLPDSAPERQESVSDSIEVEADWVLDSDSR